MHPAAVTMINNIPPALPLCTLLNMTLTPSGVWVIRALSDKLILCAIIYYKKHIYHDDLKYDINKFQKERKGVTGAASAVRDQQRRL